MNTDLSVPAQNFPNRIDWRKWLEKHAQDSLGLWVYIWKKKAQKHGLSYDEAIDEAICFGWIDGPMKGIDENKFILRLVPRKKNSIWSMKNKIRAERLIQSGKMTPTGIQQIEVAKQNGLWDTAYTSRQFTIPPDLELFLAQNSTAAENFSKFSKSIQFQYVYWINQAKTTETRTNRIHEVIRRAQLSLKPRENG